MKNLLIDFYSPKYLQNTRYLMSEDEYDKFFSWARRAFLDEFDDNNISITITYTDIERWIEEDPHELDL